MPGAGCQPPLSRQHLPAGSARGGCPRFVCPTSRHRTRPQTPLGSEVLWGLCSCALPSGPGVLLGGAEVRLELFFFFLGLVWFRRWRSWR